MTTYRDEVRELVLGTLWSLWAELGLSGWERRHKDTAVDLEPLIIATARLAHLDARLLNEALDWCVSNGRLASAVRIKHLTNAADPTTRRAIGTFTATVTANSPLNWPGGTKPEVFVATGRSGAPQLERAALIQLRLRALWGVSARAEVLRVMLSDGYRFMGISEVAALANFGKDAVAEALDNLHRGGLLDEAGSRNQRVFQLAGRRDHLVSLVGTEPSWTKSWKWPLVLPIMVGFLEVSELPEMPAMAHGAEIVRRFREWQPVLARLGLITGALGTGADIVRDHEDFTLKALHSWGGEETETRSNRPQR